MPIYSLICESCGFNNELRKKMTEPFPSACPKCGSTNYGQDYSSLAGTLSLDNIDPKSVGRQAEINASKLGYYENSERLAKAAKPKRKKGWWEEGAPDMSKVKNKQKYIETGEVS